MPDARPLNQIIAHIRAVVSNPNIDTTLIQTQDLLVLCDHAERAEQYLALLRRSADLLGCAPHMEPVACDLADEILATLGVSEK